MAPLAPCAIRQMLIEKPAQILMIGLEARSLLKPRNPLQLDLRWKALWWRRIPLMSFHEYRYSIADSQHGGRLAHLSNHVLGESLSHHTQQWPWIDLEEAHVRRLLKSLSINRAFLTQVYSSTNICHF